MIIKTNKNESRLVNSLLISGYPKSGNTMLCDIIKFSAFSIDHQYNELYNYPTLRRENITPNPLPFGNDLVLLKSHRKDITILKNFDIKKIIYIYRDPVSIFLSSLDWIVKRAKRNQDLNNNYFIHTRQYWKTSLKYFNSWPGRNWEKFYKRFNPSTYTSDQFYKILDQLIKSQGDIPLFTNVSGTMLEHAKTIRLNNIPTLLVKYENLATDNFRNPASINELSSISRFLNVDIQFIYDGYIKQNIVARQKNKSGDKFYRCLGKRSIPINASLANNIKQQSANLSHQISSVFND